MTEGFEARLEIADARKGFRQFPVARAGRGKLKRHPGLIVTCHDR
jgi:hypothetical protein